MFSLGDVIHFYSSEAFKEKFHICISLENHFLFLNSRVLTKDSGELFGVAGEDCGVLQVVQQAQ